MLLGAGEIGDVTSAGQVLTGSEPVKKMSMWHAMVVDWRLTNPSDPWSSCAKLFDVSQAWLSTIINSDLFKNYYATRLATHQEFVSKELVAKASRTAAKGLDLMHEKMDKEGLELGLGEVKDATDMAMKSLGFGVKVAQGGKTEISLNVGVLDAGALDDARAKMRMVSKLNTAGAEDAEGVLLDALPSLEESESDEDLDISAPPPFQADAVSELPTAASATGGHEGTDYIEEGDDDEDERDVEFLRTILANTS